jgi:prepilin-type N-terminal cleavage/methylation domain-containing protein
MRGRYSFCRRGGSRLGWQETHVSRSKAFVAGQRAGSLMVSRKTAARCDGGFTLVEVVIAVALVVMLAAGLYGTGSMVMRMTHFNRMALEARALGTQMIEEIAARSIADIAIQVPFANRTNRLQYGEQVVRSVQVIGHDASHGVVTNLAKSAYLELHVRAVYVSPLTRSYVTNAFSTLVQ